MVIMTAKLSKGKLAAALLIILAVVILTIVLCSGGKTPEQAPDGDLLAASTNSDRLAYLSSFGWTVNGDPVQTQQVRIPAASSEVFDRYNELQVSQGFDLTQYAGKTVNRYVYEIENDTEATDPIYATLLVYQDTIIGGDVSSSAPDGVMHGFSKPAV